MQFFLSLSFYGWVAAIAALAWLLARAGASDRLRHLFLVVANLWLLRWLYPGSPQRLAIVVGWSLAVFAAARWTLRRRAAGASPGAARWPAIVAIVLTLAALAALKFPGLLAPLRGAPAAAGPGGWRPSGAGVPLTGLVGVSYFALKFIHVLADVAAGRLTDLTLCRYLDFVLFFPTFISGPLQRYQQFRLRPKAAAPGSERVAAGLARIALGIVKKTLLTGLAQSYAITEFPPDKLLALAWWALPASICAYGLYIYLDFSGYCDMAIGVGALVGREVPENFRYPFLARNIQEFWNRWHITLAHWFRDYVYYPITLALMRATGRRSGSALPALGILITFFLMGAWHGDDRACLYYGLWHGAGLAGFKLFDETLKRHGRRLHAWMERSRVWRVVATALTLVFFLVGLVIFSGRMADVLAAIGERWR